MFTKGDRVKEGSRIGTVTAIHTPGTVDILFDDMDYAIRRQEGNVSTIRQNPHHHIHYHQVGGGHPLRNTHHLIRHTNPSSSEISVEDYSPKEEQFHAQVQGIYEGLVKERLGKKSTAPFKDSRDRRLDAKLGRDEVDQLLSQAFAIGTSVGQKHGYLKEGTNKPTLKGQAKSAARVGLAYHRIAGSLRMQGVPERRSQYILDSLKIFDQEEAWDNLLDYEKTLSLRRKGHPQRILKMKKGQKNVYVLMPDGIKFTSLKKAKESAVMPKRQLKKAANPSPPLRQVKRVQSSPITSFETRRCSLPISQLKKIPSETALYKKTQKLLGPCDSFEDARYQLLAAVGRNMAPYCIIFVKMVDGATRLADSESGAILTMDHFKRELGQSGSGRRTSSWGYLR